MLKSKRKIATLQCVGENPCNFKTKSLGKGTLYLGLLNSDEVLCSKNRSTSGILTSAYTIWIPSYTRCTCSFFNQIPLPTLSCSRPSFEINAVLAPLSPFYPAPGNDLAKSLGRGQTHGSSGPVSWVLTTKSSCWAASPPGPFHQYFLLKEVMVKASCLTSSTECEAVTCTYRKKYCCAQNYLDFYLCK